MRTKPNKPILVLSLPEVGKLVFLVDRSTTRPSEVRQRHSNVCCTPAFESLCRLVIDRHS